MKKIKILTLFSALCATGCAYNAQQQVTINKNALIEDVKVLAGDELQGRGNFTDEIGQAAQYISSRFAEIGLQPMDGLDSFKQEFELFLIKPTALNVKLNGQTITSNRTVSVSKKTTLSWDQETDLKTVYVNEDADFRKVLGDLNAEGGDHLVIVDPSHQKSFEGFRNYFGKTKYQSDLTDTGSMVMVLSDANNVESFTVAAQNDIETKIISNVVGVLPGKSKANEKVIYSAHYDHLGVDGEKIFNGADDDASGTSAVINLANYFAQSANNERSLVFVAFTAEEIGLKGSVNFAQLIDPSTVSAMINIEMIGTPSKFGPGKLWITGADKSNLLTLLNDSLTQEQQLEANPYKKYNLFYRSDNASLARLGVPAHSFSSTQMDQAKHYHKHTDDIENIDFESMYQSVVLLSKATEGLVKGEVTPSRVEINSVKSKGKIF